MFGHKKTNHGVDTFQKFCLSARKSLEDGDVKQAIQNYRRAAEIAPDQAEPHEALGAMLLPMMEIDEAVYHCKELIRLGAATATTYINLATALGNKCQLPEAVNFAKKALESSADDYIVDTAKQLIQDIEDGTYIGGPWLRKLNPSKYKNMIEHLIDDDD